MTETVVASVAIVHIVETNVFGARAHHWTCQVPGCGEVSARRDARQDGTPHGALVAAAQRHANAHTADR